MLSRFLLFSILSLILSPVKAEEPARDKLLHLVPPDTAVCFVIQGLRDQAKRISESPFAAWASERFGTRLGQTTEAGSLIQAEKALTAALGVTVSDIRDDILGDAVVFAYQFNTPQDPQERGLLLMQSRDPAKVQKLVSKYNDTRKLTGTLTKLQDHRYRDITYVEIVKTDGVSEYYLAQEKLFAFAMDEASIKGVIDRLTMPEKRTPLPATLKKMGVQDAFLLCWIAPRQLDGQLKASIALAKTEAEKASRTRMAAIWSAVDGVAIYLDVKNAIEIGVVTALQADSLPAELKSVLLPSTQHSRLWQQLPKDALAIAGGRIDMPQLLAAIEAFLPESERAAFRKQIHENLGALIGKDMLAPVMAGLGPNWGITVEPPEANSWLPSWTAAISVRSEPNPAVPTATLEAVTAFAQLMRLEYNKTHEDPIRIYDDREGMPEVKVMTCARGFPPGLKPSMGWKDGYIVFGNSPAQVRRFAPPPPLKTVDTDTAFIRLSGQAIRDYLKKNQEQLAIGISDLRQQPRDEITRALSTLVDVLEAFEKIEFFVRGEGSQLRMGVRITPVKPLQK